MYQFVRSSKESSSSSMARFRSNDLMLDATIERIGEWMSGLWDTSHNNKKETAHAAA